MLISQRQSIPWFISKFKTMYVMHTKKKKTTKKKNKQKKKQKKKNNNKKKKKNRLTCHFRLFLMGFNFWFHLFAHALHVIRFRRCLEYLADSETRNT